MNYVKIIIDQWDPIGLLTYSPSDEYDSESDKITKVLQQTNDVKILGEEIYNVFKKSFGDVFIQSRNECKDIAHKILEGRVCKSHNL